MNGTVQFFCDNAEHYADVSGIWCVDRILEIATFIHNDGVCWGEVEPPSRKEFELFLRAYIYV